MALMAYIATLPSVNAGSLAVDPLGKFDSFGGTILKIENVNYIDGDPSKGFRNLYGYAISAKRYCLFEGKQVRKIVDAKAHGIGYLMNPLRCRGDDHAEQFAAAFWRKVLQNERIALKTDEPDWLDRPAMMRIPISSPAVLGRLKEFCKPYDFVLAPVIREGDLQLAEEAEKPILVTRFNKDSEEWSGATYYNVRSGEPCSITTGESGTDNVIPVRSYRSIVSAYVNNAESKFNGPDGNQCHPGLGAYSKECMSWPGSIGIVGKNSSGNWNRDPWTTRSSASASYMGTDGWWPTLRPFGN